MPAQYSVGPEPGGSAAVGGGGDVAKGGVWLSAWASPGPPEKDWKWLSEAQPPGGAQPWKW